MRLDLLCWILTMFSTDISTSITDLYNVLLLYYMNCISLNFTVVQCSPTRLAHLLVCFCPCNRHLCAAIFCKLRNTIDLFAYIVEAVSSFIPLLSSFFSRRFVLCCSPETRPVKSRMQPSLLS